MHARLASCGFVVFAFLACLFWPLGAAHQAVVAEDVKSADAEKTAQGLELFKNDVRPALVQHCGKCHLGDDVEGEFDLGTREALLRGGTSKAAILPGDAKNSLLYRMITHDKKPKMPA